MRLAVFFPGIGYHCDKPLLYFAREVAHQCGYDEVINLNYSCEAKLIRGDDEKLREVALTLYEQAEKSLEGVDWTQYDEILFVSKSIGTAVAAAYAMRHEIKCKNIWYTPLALTFSFMPHNGIAFAGTADPWCDINDLRKYCAKHSIPLYQYTNANHSLEVGEVLDNLQILQQVMEKSRDYVRSAL